MIYDLRFKNKKGGQMLIESIVAISVTVTGLLGIFALLSSSLATNKLIGKKFVATYLAAEGIEVVRSIVDRDHTQGNSWNKSAPDGSFEVVYNSTGLGTSIGDKEKRSDNPLLFNSSFGVYQYTGGVTTQFKRTITIENKDLNGDTKNDEIVVHSIVNWPDGEVDIEDHFFDWRL